MLKTSCPATFFITVSFSYLVGGHALAQTESPPPAKEEITVSIEPSDLEKEELKRLDPLLVDPIIIDVSSDKLHRYSNWLTDDHASVLSLRSEIRAASRETKQADLSYAVTLLGARRLESAAMDLVTLLDRSMLSPDIKEFLPVSDDLRRRILRALAKIGRASIEEIIDRIETAHTTQKLQFYVQVLMEIDESKELAIFRLKQRALGQKDEKGKANLAKAIEQIEYLRGK